MKHNNPRLTRISRRLDPLWRLMALALIRDRRGTRALSPRSVLLVELNMLGDIVMLVPLLRVIRRHHPTAHIGLMAAPWARDVLESTGLVDEFILVRAPWATKGVGVRGLEDVMRALRTARRRSWDWGIDVRGDLRNGLLLTLARAKRRVGFDFTGGSAFLTDVVPDDGVMRHIVDHHADIARHLGMSMSDQEKIPTLVAPGSTPLRQPAERTIGFHFGASLELRRMPIEEACALLMTHRGRQGERLVLVDAPDIAEFNSALLRRLPAEFAVTIGRWAGSLPEFIRFLASLDAFYAMDSGPAHLAAALGVETTVFFGPHVSAAVRPLGHNVAVIERSDVSCRPCDQHRCTNPHRQLCLTGIASLTVTEPRVVRSDVANRELGS